MESAKAAFLVTQDGKDRMYDEPNAEPAIAQLPQHGVHKKGHVVVDDLKDGIASPRRGGGGGGSLEPNLRGAGLARRKERPGVLGERSQLRRVIAQEVFGRCMGKKRADEIRRRAVKARELGRGRNERRFRTFFVVSS